MPLLAINSEAFTYWPSNFDLVGSLLEEAGPAPAWLMTIRGTVHITQSDFNLLYPHICSLVLKTTANPRRALDLNINASLEFLRLVSQDSTSRLSHAFPAEGLLDSRISTLDSIPQAQLHRPREAWTAARLKIPHEWIYRTAPPLAKMLKKREIVKQGGHVGDEVWVHSKPKEKCIKDFLAGDGEEDGSTESDETKAENGASGSQLGQLRSHSEAG